MSRRSDTPEWMWSHAWALLEEAERMHRQFFHVAGSGRSQVAWEPPVDVFEDELEFIVIVAMPGVPPGRIEILSESGALVVRGQRPLPFAGMRQIVRHLEIPYGKFERRIQLPAGELDAGAPEFAHGCVIVRLRKHR
ncbi:MAG TPA: Hsp20/alpha crystallin family protein [Casimicrobiaceae bacterium]